MSRCFDLVVRGFVAHEAAPVESRWIEFWRGSADRSLAALRADIEKLNPDEDVNQVIDLLLPRLLKLAHESGNPDIARETDVSVVRAVLRRSTYLVFLNENTEALQRAVHLVSISPGLPNNLPPIRSFCMS